VRRTTPPTTPPAIARLFAEELPIITVDVATDGEDVEDVLGGREYVELGVGDDETEGCDGATTQDTSRPFVTLKILDGIAPLVAYMFIRYHPWGMFTLSQSNRPVEAFTTANVVFTVAVLCRATNGNSLRLSPL
jgi:hypothetical protein